MDELALIRSIQHDDNRNAFAFLVRRYQSSLRGYLFHLCQGQSEWADDLAQEAFLKAYRGLANFKGEAKFSTWLFQIARHLYFDARKRRLPDEDPESDSEVVDLDLRMDLNQALASLPLSERELLLLSYVDGFSNSEIAELTQIPLGTVKSRILQAKDKLTRRLTEAPACTGTN